jgi:hypothetical protein
MEMWELRAFLTARYTIAVSASGGCIQQSRKCFTTYFKDATSSEKPRGGISRLKGCQQEKGMHRI